MLKVFLTSWLVAVLLAVAPALAQPPSAPHPLPALAPADTTTAASLPPDAASAQPVRRPDEARLRSLRGQREFQYVEGKPEEPSLWDRLMARFWEWVRELLSTKGGRIAWDVIFYGVLGGALVLAVLKFLQVDLSKVFGRAPRALPLGYETGQENIHELDFTDALAQAETAGNLRLAVRLGYLQLLKQLTDRELIAWQPDKTNQTYVRELAAARPGARPPFAELTRQFEYIWYGELPLPLALYRQVRERQREFSQQITTNRLAVSGS